MNKILPNSLASLRHFSNTSAPNFAYRILSLLLFVCFFQLESSAQVIQDNYTFTASTGNFVALSSSATRVPEIESINMVSGAIPIGFTFNFNEYDFTQLYATSRGFLSFSPSVYGYAGNDLDNTPSNNRALIAPLWDYLDGRANGGSRASYETTGLPGARVFTFEWNKFEWNLNSGDPAMSFQVKLYEGSNKIEFIYRQEIGAAVSPSASIGLAGYTTLPGDFISINNNGVASFTTESFVTTKPATGQIYTFNRIRFPLDVVATGLIEPVTQRCFGPNETMKVRIKNVASAPLNLATNPVTVNASVTIGTTTTPLAPTVVNSGIIPVDGFLDVTVTNNLNMTTIGTYTFNASATVAGDGRTRNDAMPPFTLEVTQRHVPGTASLPQNIDFSAFNGGNLHTVYPGWSEMVGQYSPSLFYSNWTDDDFVNNPSHPNGKAARVIITYFVTTHSWLVSPKFTPTASTKLVFDLAMTLAGTSNASTLGTDDKFQVMISTNCGVSYTPLRTFNASTPISSGGQVEVIDLAPYAGQSVIIAFFATSGDNVDYISNEIFVDNLFIGTPADIDMGVTGLVSPIATGCYSNAEPVTVTVKNFSGTTIDFSTRPVVVSAEVSGAANTVLSKTLNTGTLAAGATQNVIVGNLNMTAAGTYNFSGRTFLTRDLNQVNNSFSGVSRTVVPTAALPQNVNFTNYNGSNLAAWFPNWQEGTGTLPTTTLSAWTDDDFANVTTHQNGKAARIQLSGTSDIAWIVGPKITPTSATKLKFDLALTNANATSAATLGSDDQFKVLVSTNCGASFTAIRTYTASTTISHLGQTETVDLAAYAGQNIIVAFSATSGTVSDPQNTDLFLDNIFIGVPLALDLGALVFVSPTPGNCYSASQTVSVSVQNLGTNAINFASTPVNFTITMSGAAAQTLYFTLNTGILAPGANQTVTIGNANFGNTGTFTFDGFFTLNGDGNPSNNNFPTFSVQNNTVAYFPHFQTFELFSPVGGLAAGNEGWAGNGSGFTWKTGSGFSSASSGPAADHTVGNASGKYLYADAATGVAGDKAELILPCLDLHGQTGIGLEFWYHMYGAGIDTLHLDVFNGTTWVKDVWIKVGQQQTAATEPWLRGFLNLTPFNGNFIKLRFRAGRGTNAAGNIALDDFYFYNLPAVDLEISQITLPASNCGLSSAETICLNLVNNGSSPVTGIPVSYKLNGGTAVSETINVTLAPAATTQYCFTTKANLSGVNTYQVSVKVNAPNDLNANNDELTGTVLSVPTIATFPYTENFDSGNGGWRSGGTNSSWAMGTPAKPVINSAASGTTAWVTNLTGNYRNRENSYVLSPCFNFSGIPNPAISLKIWRDMQDKKDGAVLQSSTDGGLTWLVIGAVGDPNNWYNRDTIAANPGNQPTSLNGRFQGWSGSSAGWVTATNELSGLGGQPNVRLRISFASDSITVKEGFAFDDVQVFNKVAIPTITANGPTTFCQGGSVVLTAASATLNVTYSWQLNGITISGATGNTYSVTGSGSYTAVATLGGSATSNPLSVTVNPLPMPSFTNLNTSYCINDPAITLTANLLGSTFTVDGVAASSFNPATLGIGNHTVSVSSTNANNCTGTTSQTVIVYGLPITPTITQNGGNLTSSSATGNQWYLNGVAIPGATAQTYVTTANGNYTVVVTSNGCASATSAVKNVTNTGIADALAGMSVDVYPNPATGSFNVKLNGYQKDATVVLYNLAGQQITKVKATADGKAQNINLKGLAAGTYLLKVTSEKGVQVSRLVVQ